MKKPTRKELERQLRSAQRRLRKINEVIYAAGAPLGSERYFTIRFLATGTKPTPRGNNAK